MTKEQAIQFCLKQITPSVLIDEKEYRKFKMYKHRIENGKAGKNAIQTLFERFGIEERCVYFVKKNNNK